MNDVEVEFRRMVFQLLSVTSISAGKNHACIRLFAADEFDRLHEAAEFRIVVGFIGGNRDVAQFKRAFRAFEITAFIVGHGIVRVGEEIGDDRFLFAVHGLDETFRVMVVVVVGDGDEIEIRDELLRAAVMEVDRKAML